MGQNGKEIETSWLTVPEAAEFNKLSDSVLRRLIRDGRLRSGGTTGPLNQ
jgi:hypothetical protein